jgi:hypothetical protein
MRLGIGYVLMRGVVGEMLVCAKGKQNDGIERWGEEINFV